MPPPNHGLRVVTLGIGEAFTARYYTTCFAVGLESDDGWILVDCPHPIRKMMRESQESTGLPIDIDNVRAVVLTHLHADHASGLEDFCYYCYFVLQRRALILAHPSVSARLWDNLLSAGMSHLGYNPDGSSIIRTLDDYIELIPLDERRPVEVGPYLIESRPTRHSIPCTAVKIRAGGRTLGISADTIFDPELIDWLDTSDLVLHEACGGETSPVHAPYARIATLPTATRSKMRLYHLPDDFGSEGRAVEVLRQGECYRV